MGVGLGAVLLAALQKRFPGMSNEDVTFILMELQSALTRNPELIEEVASGQMLIRKPMTPKERASRALPVANAVRRQKRQEHSKEVQKLVDEWVDREPAITVTEVVARLNAMAVKPLRGDTWSPRSAYAYLKDARRRE